MTVEHEPVDEDQRERQHDPERSDDEPFEQEQLNGYLQRMLEDGQARAGWSRNGLAFADSADLYSMPQHAADVILGQENP